MCALKSKITFNKNMKTATIRINNLNMANIEEVLAQVSGFMTKYEPLIQGQNRSKNGVAQNVISMLSSVAKSKPGANQRKTSRSERPEAVEKKEVVEKKMKKENKKKPKKQKKVENPVVSTVQEPAATLPQTPNCPKCVRTEKFRDEAREQLKVSHESAERLTKRLLAVEEELEDNYNIIEELQREQDADLEKELEAMKVKMAELIKKNQELKKQNSELRLSL